MENKRNTFGGTLGFVLAAAGSAVGLGNIWRFPYLAAKDGGGLFIIVYIILALTFGYTLLSTEIAIGRKTKQSPRTAYGQIKKGWSVLGFIAVLIPGLILTYYTVIGGWVVKYFVAFVSGDAAASAQDGYFTDFITNPTSSIIMLIVFLGLSAIIIFMGVNKGIESSSKIIMPVLIVLILVIVVYTMTLSFTDETGVTRTGLQGLKVYLIPSFEGITLKKFAGIVLDAMGQLFFSLSVAMGIMVAYGSYVSDDEDLVKSTTRIELFDTGIAIFVGMLIIPAVFTFMGREGMESSGPSLMFVTLPKVFASMGFAGTIVGAVFFGMVLFAALTSCISIMEAVVSSIIDRFHTSRMLAAAITTAVGLFGGIIVCLGYNKLYFELKLPNGSTAQILDLMDYISNSILMPVVAIATCILIGWVVGPKYITDEIEKNGENFNRKRLYNIMIKYIAPILLVVLFVQSFI